MNQTALNKNKPFPTLFVGHGSPMISIQDNRYTKAWKYIGDRLPKPSAILMVSAHWYEPETAVTVSTSPKTIHDFYGFPDELYQIQYPAPGDQALAERVKELLSPITVNQDDNWGLDHGAWSVLKHMYPNADIPVVQISINSNQPAQFHYELGRKLQQLRHENLMIIGSGNIVHNLRHYTGDNATKTQHDWAIRFEDKVKDLLVSKDHKSLIEYKNLGPDAALSIPTPEHYLPLLYILGASLPDETINIPIDGVESGSISMLAIEIGS
ncbi:4,5-DOPA dioxygenase extradiol [uncultured Cocleimonas sp.]|uniref:4,5-DOPA-extradiol-dioxygenase n=1 Tax=uncultured Cocleimonas sp. TaxID=1051587 RepID=UPI00262B5E94|nr:4,5-DOPA dioxygenase extradiol [uncultured Cocleimonas sp.]